MRSAGLRGTGQWCMLTWRRGEPALAEDGRKLCGPRRSWGGSRAGESTAGRQRYLTPCAPWC